MEEKTKKKKNHFFEIYISKVLKQISQNCGITSNAKQQLNSFLCILSKYISALVFDLTLFGKKKTISDKEVENGLNIILSGELLSNSISEGKKAVENFKTENKKGTRQNKAGIIFPPSITEKFLRNFGNSKIMITSVAPVYLAAVLEYITYEILDLASINAKDNKRIRITIRDLELVIRLDDELDKLFNKVNISFLGGGVVPYIHETLLKKNKKKKITGKPPINKNIKQQHRFRPGTVAIRDIKKHQKSSDCLILAKSSFEKIIRNIFKENKEDNIKISKDVFIILQHFIEQYVVKLFYNSNFLAIHSGRVKLLSTDIAFVSYLTNDTKNPYNSFIKDNNSVLSIYDNINLDEEITAVNLDDDGVDDVVDDVDVEDDEVDVEDDEVDDEIEDSVDDEVDETVPPLVEDTESESDDVLEEEN
jgi:histone H2A